MMLVTPLFAQEVPSISFGPVKVGENRIPLSSTDFEIQKDSSLKGIVAAKLIKDSLQWIRVEKVLLSPRMKLAISVKKEAKNVTLEYEKKNILMQQVKNRAYAQFWYNLFYPDDIAIYVDGKKIGKLRVVPVLKERKSKNIHLVDYSCASSNIQISGLEQEYYSVGCWFSRSGKIGKEKGTLQVFISTPNLKLQNGSLPPYRINMVHGHASKVNMVDGQGNVREVTIKSDIPKRVHRFKTAIGFGPYLMTSQHGDKIETDRLTSPLFLYGKFDLKPNTSFRFFDAAIYQKSFFNNFGFYFAYDAGHALDGRFVITPLLGIQTISFDHRDTDDMYSEVIYPQGFEFAYRHAFGFKNFHMVYGMFISTKSSEDYKNVWLRWGKRTFWEVNFLSWRNGLRYSKSWGLSVGIPFLSFL
jgi:hypothetical protein